MKENNLKILYTQTILEGGAADYMLELVEGLKDKYSIYVISGYGRYIKRVTSLNDRFTKLEVLERAINPIKDFFSFFKIMKLLRKIKPDIIHTHNTKDGFLFRVAGRLSGVPLIIRTYHGNFFQERMSKWQSFIAKLIEKVLEPLTDFFFTVSEFDRNNITKSGIVKPSKITTVYNGFNIDRVTSVQVDIQNKRKELGIEEGFKIVGNVAGLYPAKAHWDLVSVVEEVIKRFTKIIFIIVGDGPLFKNIEKMINDKHLKNYIKLLGFRNDALEIMKIFDVFLLTSHWEGTSRAMIEAMLLKIPVVSSDVGGHKEIIRDGISGFLVEPENINGFVDKVLLLLNDPVKAYKMADNAYKFVVENFDHKNMIAQIETIYKKLLVEK